MDDYKTIKQIAEHFGVTVPAVEYWVKNGLKTKKERVIGRKERRIISLHDAKEFLQLRKLSHE